MPLLDAPVTICMTSAPSIGAGAPAQFGPPGHNSEVVVELALLKTNQLRAAEFPPPAMPVYVVELPLGPTVSKLGLGTRFPPAARLILRRRTHTYSATRTGFVMK